MIRLLGRATSINVRKVQWTCTELGLAVRQETWGAGTERSTQDPAFLALNPNGLVPVLIDGNRVLWESNTICRYLAARQGRTDLLPASPGERAAVEQWMDWQATELNTAWRFPFMARVRGSAAHQDEAWVERGTAEWNRLMALLDGQLARTGAWVVGDRFTLADIVLALSTWRWLQTPIERPVLPAVEAWLARLAPRAGWQQTCTPALP